MAGITLAQIRQAADDKYGPFVVEGIEGGNVTMLNAIRLSKAKRKKLADMQKLQDDPEADQEQMLRDMVILVASSKPDGERLLKALGDDMAQLAVVLEEYGKSSAAAPDAP